MLRTDNIFDVAVQVGVRANHKDYGINNDEDKSEKRKRRRLRSGRSRSKSSRIICGDVR